MRKNTVLFIALLSVFALFGSSTNSAGAPTPAESTVSITSIDPTVGAEGATLTIKGEGFGDEVKDVSVKFKSSVKEYEGAVLTCKKKEITVSVPRIMENEFVDVAVYRGQTASSPVKFGMYADKLVNEAVNLKKAGKSDAFIADLLFNQGLPLPPEGTMREQVFGNFKFAPGDAEKLSQAGLSDDFIEKFQGQKQHVTLGLAGVWLNKTSDFVPAPMLRILLEPRGYYYEQKEYLPYTKIPYLTWLRWPAGLLDLKRWDLNVGVTSATSTTKNPDGQNGKTNFILAGLSHEINRAAFLNAGVAVATGSTEGIKKQYYFGITVDSNLLKVLGIVNP